MIKKTGPLLPPEAFLSTPEGIEMQRQLCRKIQQTAATADLLKKAIAFATEKHEGQFRIDGLPYITHPLGVAELLHDMKAKIVAVLHDVLEDTNATEEEIAALGVNEESIAALRLLTHDWNTATYEEYVENISHDPLAKAVKPADLQYNMATIDDVPEPKRTQLRTRYLTAQKFLTDGKWE